MTTMKNMLLRWFRFGQNIHRVPRRKMTAKKKIYKFDDEKKKKNSVKAHYIFVRVCTVHTLNTHTHTIWRENHIKWLHMARIYGNTDTHTPILRNTQQNPNVFPVFFLRKLSHSRLFVIWSWCVVWQCLSLLCCVVHA